MNFTNCEVNKFKMFGGANGSKICIRYNGEDYMLKFPPKPTKTEIISYSNSCTSEHICCKIFNSLGIKAQEADMELMLTISWNQC